MGALNRRVYLELQALKVAHERLRLENLRLRRENGRLVHECRLAYLEGVDQGQALSFHAEAS